MAGLRAKSARRPLQLAVRNNATAGAEMIRPLAAPDNPSSCPYNGILGMTAPTPMKSKNCDVNRSVKGPIIPRAAAASSSSDDDDDDDVGVGIFSKICPPCWLVLRKFGSVAYIEVVVDDDRPGTDALPLEKGTEVLLMRLRHVVDSIEFLLLLLQVVPPVEVVNARAVTTT